MNALAQRRARITRVREVQHLQAASEAATAENKVVQLEGNAARLTALRTSLTAAPGATNGAALGSAAELGSRLDQVRSGLNDAIGQARATAAQAAGVRLAANIAKESAAKLEIRAVAELQEMIEARMAAGIRHRGKEQRHG
jgi:hypothetical protein